MRRVLGAWVADVAGETGDNATYELGEDLITRSKAAESVPQSGETESGEEMERES